MVKIIRTTQDTVANAQLTSSTDIYSSLERDVAAAITSNDATEIAKVQLKLSLTLVDQLTKIDWKLWEFYNRLGK